MTEPRSGVSVDAERRDGAVVIRVRGDLDLAGVPPLEEALDSAEGTGDPIVVDVRRVSFIDSAGLRCLLQAGRRARRNGHRLALRSGPTAVHRVFELTRADRVLDFID